MSDKRPATGLEPTSHKPAEQRENKTSTRSIGKKRTATTEEECKSNKKEEVEVEIEEESKGQVVFSTQGIGFDVLIIAMKGTEYTACVD